MTYYGLHIRGCVEPHDQSPQKRSPGAVIRWFRDLVRQDAFDLEDDLPVLIAISSEGRLDDWQILARDEIHG